MPDAVNDKSTSNQVASQETSADLTDDQLRELAEIIYRLMLNDLRIERERLARP
jgi:hypothetical protein